VTLAETQDLFHALVTGAEVEPGRLEACFLGSAALPAAERVAIYAEMWLWRQVEALRETFPKLAAVLGAVSFLALAEAYVRARPSEHHDIGRLGRDLPAFLRQGTGPGRPDLADMAALEWARDEVFLEAPAAPAGRPALAGLSPGSFPSARLRFVPALRLLELAHDSGATWGRLERGEAAGPPEPGTVAVAVWRSGFDVLHARLDPDEALALGAALRGEPLSAVCETFAGRPDPAAAASGAIASWLDEGWVAAVE
jgi:hypothetical protein